MVECIVGPSLKPRHLSMQKEYGGVVRVNKCLGISQPLLYKASLSRQNRLYNKSYQSVCPTRTGLGYKSSMNEFYTTLYIISLSQSQMKHLMSVGLPLLFDTLQCFVHWIQVGWYDFHSLPLTMKSHLDQNDVISLRTICKQYNGKISLLRPNTC